MKSQNVLDIDLNFNMRSIYETEANNISLDFNFLDQKKFTWKSQPYREPVIIHKESGVKYSPIIFHKEIDNFYRHEFVNFFRGLNTILQLNHPSILKFTGFSPLNLFMEKDYPVIFTEYIQNQSLLNQFYRMKNKEQSEDWNDTKKLINIYGIASGMAYLHSHNIIHRDLKIEHIFLDENFYPKIGGFKLSKELKNNEQSIKGKHKIKGTPAYLAPEIYTKREYSKSSDVYSFSYIIYEIMTNERPFENIINPNELYEEIIKQHSRPKFNTTIPTVYRKLIEECWNEEPTKRPTFDLIIQQLKTNSEFITNTINEHEFTEYIKLIENSNITFNTTKRIQQLDDFIESKCHIYPKYNVDINMSTIYKTEANNICFKYKNINLNRFQKLKMINEGKYYKVYQLIDKETNSLYAGRILINIIDSKPDEINDFCREINISSRLNHPTIVKYIGFSQYDFKMISHPVIVTEFASNGSLFQILKSEREGNRIEGWYDTKKLITLYGISIGMKYIHSQNIIHGDLKPSNILFNDFFFPLIADFNISRDLSNKLFPISPKMAPYLYSSPENLKNNVTTKAFDVYSFSICAYEIITGKLPFNCRKANYIDTFSIINGKRPDFNTSIPQCYRKLIEKCWSQDPNERPTFDEIVDILRNDQEFITDTVNKEEYYEYINFIDDSIKGNVRSYQAFQKVKINFPQKEKGKLKFSINMETVNLQNYEKGKKIGEGGFGSVYKVKEKQTGNQFAAKVSRYELCDCDEDIIVNLSREVDIISQLNHPSILKYIGYSPKNFKLKPKPTIVTELASNGSLENIIEMERNGIGLYDWDNTKKLINIYGIASGMAYLHRLNIIHRDLKPGNILLDDLLYPKIGNFGLSKELPNKYNEKNDQKSGYKGT